MSHRAELFCSCISAARCSYEYEWKFLVVATSQRCVARYRLSSLAACAWAFVRFGLDWSAQQQATRNTFQLSNVFTNCQISRHSRIYTFPSESMLSFGRGWTFYNISHRAAFRFFSFYRAHYMAHESGNIQYSQLNRIGNSKLSCIKLYISFNRTVKNRHRQDLSELFSCFSSILNHKNIFSSSFLLSRHMLQCRRHRSEIVGKFNATRG